VYTVSAGIESGRVEFPKDEFVAKVNQLNNIDVLSSSECSWLVPEFLSPRSLQTPWGGRLTFLAEAETGQVNIGAPGKSGLLEFELTAEPLLYEIETPADFDRGVVFRNGVMVIGPGTTDPDS